MTILVLAALAFQLLWSTALAFMIWAPPAYVGIVAGWMTHVASGDLVLSLVCAVLAHRASRCVLKSVVVAYAHWVWRRCAP